MTSAEGLPSPLAAPPDRPEITVVVLSRDEATTAATTRSIEGQRLPAPRRETLVIEPSAEQLSETLARCSTPFVTVVEGGDRLSPEHLAACLGLADAKSVVVGHRALGDPESSTVLDFSTAPTRESILLAGKRVSFLESPSLTAASSGAVLPLELARQGAGLVPKGSLLASWQWLELLASGAARVRPAPLSEHCVVYAGATRAARAEAHGSSLVTSFLDLASRLDFLRRQSPEVSEQVGELSELLATQLGELVAGAAVDYGELVAELEQRPGLELPRRTLNARAARDLVIAYGFPPTGGTSGAVVARRIDAQGIPVDVVSNDIGQRKEGDPSSTEIAEPFLGRHFVADARPTVGRWSRIERFCWQAVKEIEVAERAKGPYRSIYSRSMWPASHALGALFKSRSPATPWTAEFSDPLLVNSRGETRFEEIRPGRLLTELTEALERAGQPVPDSDNGFVWLEHLVYALADTVVFTNERQREYMLSYSASPELRSRVMERSEVRPHPVPSPRLYQVVSSDYALPQDRVNIGYFGAFYKIRGANDLLLGLQGLSPQERESVLLHVFTRAPEEVQETAERLGVGTQVRANTYVPYLEFLNLTTRLDWLVVADARAQDTLGTNPYLPSKLSEYAGSGTPVWAIIEPGSTLDAVHEGLRSKLGDAESATAAVRELLRRAS